jgi:hypothetical protein
VNCLGVPFGGLPWAKEDRSASEGASGIGTRTRILNSSTCVESAMVQLDGVDAVVARDHDLADRLAHSEKNSASSPLARLGSRGSPASILRFPPHRKKRSAEVFFARITYPRPHCGYRVANDATGRHGLVSRPDLTAPLSSRSVFNFRHLSFIYYSCILKLTHAVSQTSPKPFLAAAG